jgi:hypothetical protein
MALSKKYNDKAVPSQLPTANSQQDERRKKLRRIEYQNSKTLGAGLLG